MARFSGYFLRLTASLTMLGCSEQRSESAAGSEASEEGGRSAGGAGPLYVDNACPRATGPSEDRRADCTVELLENGICADVEGLGAQVYPISGYYLNDGACLRWGDPGPRETLIFSLNFQDLRGEGVTAIDAGRYECATNPWIEIMFLEGESRSLKIWRAHGTAPGTCTLDVSQGGDIFLGKVAGTFSATMEVVAPDLAPPGASGRTIWGNFRMGR